jgi:hypothetical protein
MNLFKGNYTVSFFLLCEKGVHLYASANPSVTAGPSHAV